MRNYVYIVGDVIFEGGANDCSRAYVIAKEKHLPIFRNIYVDGKYVKTQVHAYGGFYDVSLVGTLIGNGKIRIF